ncbi:hypothetical protein ACFCX0_21175 [Streptomyces sp. NPDC056352]|uniref:hypothetical protein n=1 Tax=Streptomyces sp. NPDC056352 TaxID=3345791 RepID=UPI0035E297C3
MDTQQISVPSHAPSRAPGSAAPSSGVVHINSRHTSCFTVVGNHLAQHRELSLLAIGLGLHVQSLQRERVVEVLLTRFAGRTRSKHS